MEKSEFSEKEQMSRDSNIRPLILPFFIGIGLGIIAKFTDGREFLYFFPVFADIMGRFGIWVWVAALIAIRSKKPLLAAIRKESHYANFISSLPFTIFFTEWYLTAFAVRDWVFSSARDEMLFGIAYLCFTFSLLTVIPTNKKRLFTLLYGSLLSIILILLIQAEIIVNPYEQLLNI